MFKGIAGLFALLSAAPVFGAPTDAAVPVPVRASVVKPLILTSTGSLNFGTIILNGLSANRTVSLDTANVRDCGGNSGQLICSGPTSVASYNVKGTNNRIVTITKTASNLVNASNGTTLLMNLVGPTSIILPNSGVNGANFAIGGSITLTPTTGEGVYSGTVNVTVDYQ